MLLHEGILYTFMVNYIKLIAISLLMIFLFSCEDSEIVSVNKSSGSIILSDYKFSYDISASFPSILQPNYKIGEDTLVIYDYWALSQQPTYIASVSLKEDTIVINYEINGFTVNDWTPTVETMLKIDISKYSGIPIIKLPAVSDAREPTSEESGFRDAREIKVFQFPY